MMIQQKIHTLLYYLAICCFAFIARAQDQDSVHKYVYLEDVDTYLSANKTQKMSLETYQDIADSYYFNVNMKKASQWYARCLIIEPNLPAEYLFRYAQSLKAQKRYKKANLILEKFAKVAQKDSRAKMFKNTPNYLDIIALNSGRYYVENLSINSQYSDFGITFSQEHLFFTSARDSISERYSWSGEPFSEIYIADLQDQNVTNIRKVKGDVNTDLNESSCIFTKDGTTMYFTRNNIIAGKEYFDTDGINKLKIYRATKKAGVWTDVQELPFNKKGYSASHPTLSLDEKTLYFASDMPGTIGASDIFKVAIHTDGGFGEPENLGATINTEARETFPFIDQRGNLYFSSDGQLGLGGLDIFLSPVTSSGIYTDVINVGAPINSEFDDFSFIINIDTNNGYFASNRKQGFGSDDLYAFVEATKSTSKKELITLADHLSNPKQNSGQVLRLHHLKKPKHKDMVGVFVPKEQELTPDTDLTQTLKLEKIYFDFGANSLTKEARLELEKLLIVLKEYPSLQIAIGSHTDSRGSDSYNLLLSQKRAEATRNYLVTRGIDPDRLTAKGYGETRPVNSCTNGYTCSESLHADNRRTEFVITSFDGQNTAQKAPEKVTSLLKMPTPEEKQIGNSKKIEKLSDMVIYTVQVGAFSKDPSTISFDKLQMYSKKLDDGMIRYFSGTFFGVENAKEHLKFLKTQGFLDAFVVGLKGNTKIPVKP